MPMRRRLSPPLTRSSAPRARARAALHSQATVAGFWPACPHGRRRARGLLALTAIRSPSQVCAPAPSRQVREPRSDCTGTAATVATSSGRPVSQTAPTQRHSVVRWNEPSSTQGSARRRLPARLEGREGERRLAFREDLGCYAEARARRGGGALNFSYQLIEAAASAHPSCGTVFARARAALP